MNKVVAVLGVIVLLTLAMLFFGIGFFTGSTVTPGSISGAISEEMKKIASGEAAGGTGSSDSAGEKMSKDAVDRMLTGVGDVKSAKLSDKIMGILAAAGYSVENFSEIVKAKAKSFAKSSFRKKNEGNQITVESLLREMAISHDPQDDCSTTKTMSEINKQKMKPVTDRSLYGKKVVFIGYFKNSVSLQIQKLLATKGYKTHVEMSKDGHDSFVFCGPFKKDESAEALLKWLKLHDFSEARLISISKEAIEETLYDAMNDEGDELPKNTEVAATAATVSSANAAEANIPAASGASVTSAGTGAKTGAVPAVSPAVGATVAGAPAVGVVGRGGTAAVARPGAASGVVVAVARPGTSLNANGTVAGFAGNFANPALNQTLNGVAANPVQVQNRAVVPNGGSMVVPQNNVAAVANAAAATTQLPGAQINLPRM